MKIFKIIAVLLVLVFILLELFVFNSNEENKEKKPVVSVSTFSLYDITHHIVGDSVELVNILPFGVDPHSFELTPKIMAKIEKSALVFYSGAGLEPWVEKISFNVAPVNMSFYVKLRELGSDEFEFHKHHDKQCAHNTLDPHYWLDFQNMKKMTAVITKELIRILPANKEIYEANREAYMKMLDSLDAKYKAELASCKLRHVIINHNSLGYLAHRYGFHAESLSGLSPEADPTSTDIKRVLQEIKEDGVSTVFYESFVNSKVMKSISEDSHVEIEVLQPLGNITADEARAGATYESLMLQNLEKLSKAMICR